MGSIALISKDESVAAFEHAAELARELIGSDSGYLPPAAKIGSLSEFEWNKLVVAVVSGWVQERSRQLTAERLFNEHYFLATGEVPEPCELGMAAVALPALGDLVEKLGLGEAPIGTWSKDQILMFVWTAYELVHAAKTARDERPGPIVASELLV